MRSSKRRTYRLDTAVLGLVAVLLGIALLIFWLDRHAGAFPNRSQALIVVTRQASGQVTFEVYENIGILWSKPGAARAISTLLVTTRRDRMGATALWQVETLTPQQGPITYGRVTEGFVQMIPGTGAPPALRADDAYNVTVLGPGGTGRAHFTLHTPSRGPR